MPAPLLSSRPMMVKGMFLIAHALANRIERAEQFVGGL